MGYTTLNRTIFVLAVIGMVVTAHLCVQKARNFDQGCWGISSEGALPRGGCNDSKLREMGDSFGLPLPSLAYGYFLVIGGLSLGTAAFRPSMTRHCQRISVVIALTALPLAVFLPFFQLFVAHAVCALCLIVSLLVITLAILHIWLRRRSYPVLSTADERMADIGFMSTVGFISAGALLLLLLFVDEVGIRRLDKGAGLRQLQAVVAGVQAQLADVDRRAPGFNRAIPPIKQRDWVNPSTPPLKSANGVSLIAFLEPNCVSCKHTFAILEGLASAQQDRVSVYIIPRLLWERSLLQGQALELAKANGKYYEMWKLQLDRQKPSGMKLSDVTILFKELGIDTDRLNERLQTVKSAVISFRKKTIDAGITSTPTIFIDGIAVNPASVTISGLSMLIEQIEKSRVKDGAPDDKDNTVVKRRDVVAAPNP